jgi:FkbM family methyltransferase
MVGLRGRINLFPAASRFALMELRDRIQIQRRARPEPCRVACFLMHDYELRGRADGGEIRNSDADMKIPYLNEPGTPLASLPLGKRLRAPFVRQLRRAHRQFRQFPKGAYRTIFDIGVCHGEFTDLALAYFEPEKIWLVEADPELAEKLKAKYGKNPRCEVAHAAITDQSGDVTFQVNEHRPSSSLLSIGEKTGEVFGKSMKEEFSVTVPGRSLDDFFEEHGIESVDLMKVDIQGAERLLIQGGQKALQKVRLLYIEVLFEECYKGCALFSELDPLLRSTGFKLRAMDDFRRGSDGGLAYGNGLYFRSEVS